VSHVQFLISCRGFFGRLMSRRSVWSEAIGQGFQTSRSVVSQFPFIDCGAVRSSGVSQAEQAAEGAGGRFLAV